MLQETAPNSASVWITLITSLTTMFTVVVTQLLANKRSDRKAGEVKTELVAASTEIKNINVAQSSTLGKVYSAVNGEREAARARIAALEAEVATLRERPAP